MCRVKTTTLNDFYNGRYDWKSLTPEDQRAVVGELLRMRDIVDAYLPKQFERLEAQENAANEMHLDFEDAAIMYEFLTEERAALDALNLITHRIN